MIDINKLYRGPNGGCEILDFGLQAEDFEGSNEIDLLSQVELKISLIRVDDGIVMNIISLSANVGSFCVKCGDSLKLKINVNEGEWLFYESPPKHYDFANEMLMIDLDRYEINPKEPIRQEILLNTPFYPRCDKDCAYFDEATQGVKALADLKKLWES